MMQRKKKTAMPKASKPSRTPRPADINPDFVEYDSTKPKHGRPLTVTAKIRNPPSKVPETCSLKLFPKVAARIQQDLLWHARSVAAHHKPDLINNSLIGELLTIAVGPPEKTKRQWHKANLRLSIEAYGPWIHWFALRVSEGNRISPKFKNLLEEILSKAKSAGYRRNLFQSTHRPPRYLYSTLAAFLVEFCVGGAELWTDGLHTIPPVKLISQSLERQRSRQGSQNATDPTGVKNIFKTILGNEYEKMLETPTGKTPTAPPAIRRLLNPSRKSTVLFRSQQ
jgi:hypothetical protein